MRKVTAILCILLLGTAWCKAQTDVQFDVLHLKDDRTMEGTIIELHIDSLVVLRNMADSVVHIPLADIARITKKRIDRPAPVAPAPVRPESNSRRTEYDHRPKGFFGNVKINVCFAGGIGLGVAFGYKFNRFAHLGLGLGIDLRGYTVGYLPDWDDVETDAASGFNMPVYVQLAGEVLTRQKTPFYLVEVGYLPQFINLYAHKNRVGGMHGMHTGLVVGYRFNTHSRYNFSLGMRVDFDSFAIKHRVFELDETTDLYHYHDTETFTSAVYLGIAFIHGF